MGIIDALKPSSFIIITMTRKATSHDGLPRGTALGRSLAKSRNVCFSALTVTQRSTPTWPVSLVVRTLGFQPGRRGSIPLQAAMLA